MIHLQSCHTAGRCRYNVDRTEFDHNSSENDRVSVMRRPEVRKWKFLPTVILCLAMCGEFFFVGCKKRTTSSGESKQTSTTNQVVSKPVIYTSFYPMQYFTKRIAGDFAKVVCPVPSDADPIFWQPSRKVIAEFQNADLIILNGAEYEKWVLTTALPDDRVIRTARPLADSYITFKTTTHSHGLTGKHTHQGIDGHTWMDPVNAKIQANKILEALKDRYADHSEPLPSNFKSLAVDLDALKGRFEEITQKLDGCMIICSHPAWNYVARRYGWTIHNLALDPAGIPTDKELASLTELTKGHRGLKIVLWESEPISETADLLRNRFGIISITFSPCETLNDSDRENGINYISVMNANLDRLEAALP